MADEDDDESNNKICFEEIQFFPIISQTNVYGLNTFGESNNGYNKVLLACLKGNILSISSPHCVRPSSLSSVNVPLKNYLTQGADIVSIDAYNSVSGLHVGATFIKDGHTDFQKQYLNIYYGKEGEVHTKLESIVDCCQTIELDFVPFQLTHFQLVKNDEKDNMTVFLLSGSDERIHMFAKDPVNKQFVEQKVEEHFPEFDNLPSSVIWMSIYRDSINERRICGFACQNGFLKVAVVDKTEIISEWSTTHDGPVSSLKIFTLEAEQYSVPEELKDVIQLPHENNHDDKAANYPVHVLVTGVIEPSVIYEDILNNGLSKLSILPDSDKYDCVVCSHVTDVDWDGANEILLGTYGQELLVYKLNQECNETSKRKLRAKLCWTKSFAQPLYAIDYKDLTNDGVRELIVASSKGLHVLQHKFTEIAKRFQEEFTYNGEDGEDSSEKSDS